MKEISRCYCLFKRLLSVKYFRSVIVRSSSTTSSKVKSQDSDDKLDESLKLNNRIFKRDEFSNVTPKILACIDKNLHCQKYHPLFHLKQRIIDHFYKSYVGRTGNPIFSVYDNFNPVVSTHQNFDSLLIPLDHVCRSKNDCYYVNKDVVLRSHMTAHQAELIKMGLDSFILFGDVYRRDVINSTHYPVFHQVDAARLFYQQQVNIMHIIYDFLVTLFG